MECEICLEPAVWRVVDRERNVAHYYCPKCMKTEVPIRYPEYELYRGNKKVLDVRVISRAGFCERCGRLVPFIFLVKRGGCETLLCPSCIVILERRTVSEYLELIYP